MKKKYWTSNLDVSKLKSKFCRIFRLPFLLTLRKQQFSKDSLEKKNWKKEKENGSMKLGGHG